MVRATVIFMCMVIFMRRVRVIFMVMVMVKECKEMSKIPENKEFDEKYWEWIKSLIEAYGEN
jgi:hypothetical protein